MKFSVDLGFGYIKACDERGNKILFPSLVGEKINYTGIGDIFGYKDDYIVKIKDNGTEKDFFVGDTAIPQKFERNWEAQMNLETLKLFIGTSICALLSNDDETNIVVDELALGLPLTFFNKYADDLKHKLSNISFDIKLNDGLMKHISIIEPTIFLQGLGAYYYSLYDFDLRIRDVGLLSRPVGFIEIGYRTTDYFLIMKGKRSMQLIEQASGTLENEGMNLVYNEIQSRLLSEKGISVDTIDIENALNFENGELNYLNDSRQEKINIKKFEDIALKNLADTILKRIDVKFTPYKKDLASIVISGGGGQKLFPYLKQKYKQAELQDDSQFANVFGFMINIKLIDKVNSEQKPNVNEQVIE